MFSLETNSACGAQLVSNTAFDRGQMICQVTDYRLTPRPTYQTVQVSRDLHLEELGLLAYLNHSCQPNTRFDATTLTLVALCDIAPGDELTFFYPSTEWQMARPFVCLCGAPRCLGAIAGAKYLPIDVLSRYALNRHIHEVILASLTSGADSADRWVPEMEPDGALTSADSLLRAAV